MSEGVSSVCECVSVGGEKKCRVLLLEYRALLRIHTWGKGGGQSILHNDFRMSVIHNDTHYTRRIVCRLVAADTATQQHPQHPTSILHTMLRVWV